MSWNSAASSSSLRVAMIEQTAGAQCYKRQKRLLPPKTRWAITDMMWHCWYLASEERETTREKDALMEPTLLPDSTLGSSLLSNSALTTPCNTFTNV